MSLSSHFASHIQNFAKIGIYILGLQAKSACFSLRPALKALLHVIIVVPCFLGSPTAVLTIYKILQNSAAHVLNRGPEGGVTLRHITPVLKFLHWLLVYFWINFKVLFQVMSRNVLTVLGHLVQLTCLYHISPAGP